jgi:ketosteroid isomerase-like protein
MKPFFLSVLLSASFLGTPAFANTPAAPPPPEAEQAAAFAVDDFGAKLAAGDLDGAAAWLADDLVVLESGGSEVSKAQYLAEHAPADAEFLRTATMTQRRRRVDVVGDVAWVLTEGELAATRDGEATTYLTTETMVLRCTDAGWRIVHIHWSSRPKS